MSKDDLEDAIDLIRTGAGKHGYRSYPGTGGIWCGRNQDVPDANFVDWGLARATAMILNAVVQGRLVLTEEIEERFREAKEKANRSASISLNSYGAGYDLGYHDALGELLESLTRDMPGSPVASEEHS